MIPLTNHDFQWGRSEVVIIYPDEITISLGFSLHGDNATSETLEGQEGEITPAPRHQLRFRTPVGGDTINGVPSGYD